MLLRGKSARYGRMHVSNEPCVFDHLIGTGEESGADGKSLRLRGCQANAMRSSVGTASRISSIHLVASDGRSRNKPVTLRISGRPGAGGEPGRSTSSA